MSRATITRWSPHGKILSGYNFDISGFTDVIIVVLNTNFRLVSICTLIVISVVQDSGKFDIWRTHELQGNFSITRKSRKVFNLVGVAKLYVHIHNYSSNLYSHRKLGQSEVKLSSRKKENLKKWQLWHMCATFTIYRLISHHCSVELRIVKLLHLSNKLSTNLFRHFVILLSGGIFVN